MKLDFYTLLDLFFPPSEDELRLRSVTDEFLVHLYTPETNNEVTSLLPYQNQVVRSVVHLVKFHAHPRATKLLGSVLEMYLSSAQTSFVLIPIPLSGARLRKRGYNQVVNIIKQALRKPSVHQLEERVLLRQANTVPQTSLKRKERLVNVAEAFVVSSSPPVRSSLAGKHILIIDDVTTTGATLKAAQAVLAPLSPASITLLALAH